MSCEGGSGDREFVVCDDEGRLADGCPFGDLGHVDVGQQADLSVFVLPFAERLAGVDRSRESHEIVGRANAFGRRDLASVLGIGHALFVAGLDLSDIIHEIHFVDGDHFVVAAVVGSYSAACDVVVHLSEAVDIGYERAAVGREVGDYVAVVGRIDDFAVCGIGQTEQSSGVGLGVGRHDVAVVGAAVYDRLGAEDAGDVAQTSALGARIGIHHVAVVLAFDDVREGVGCGDDARSASCRNGHVSVIYAAQKPIGEGRCAGGVRESGDASDLSRGESVGVGGTRIRFQCTVVCQIGQLRNGILARAGAVDEADEPHGHQLVCRVVAFANHR